MERTHFLASIADMVASLNRLMETTSPVGPILLMFAPALICALCRRLGHAAMSAFLAFAALTAFLADQGAWAAPLFLIAWLLPLHAAESRRRERAAYAIRDELAAMRADLRKNPQGTSGIQPGYTP